MTALAAGANTVLPDGPWLLSVTGEVDVSAVVLSSDGKVVGDGDLVFYNQPSAPGIRLSGSSVTIDSRRLRPGARRVVVVATPEDAGASFGRAGAPALTVAAGGRQVARFRPTGLGPETLVQLAEVYLHQDRWKLRALGSGYADGLAGLARDMGVDVDDEPAAAPVDDLPAEVVRLTNLRRAEHGLHPLRAERRLAEAARVHNDDMVAQGFFAHESPDGSSVADRVRRAGYEYAVVAENLAAGQRTAQEVVQGWLDSPGHRRNLLSADVREIGVAYRADGPYGTTWTQVFGTPR
ncbi:MAG TPA: CAP domain-containing protein [Mycobacteriales bacterium]|nr:CAP domain-containing protein [Mycobacteriales bacterium]